MLTETQIKELSKKYSFYLKKSLGQNFLIDRNVRDKIIRLLALKKSDVILEIGSGLGALTEELAKACEYVYALEKDRKIYSLSKELLSEYKNLEIIHCDFLKFELGHFFSKEIKIVGALPYYITASIIQRLLKFRRIIHTSFIIVQKEVGRRMLAGPSTDDYSAFSLFVQFYADVEILMDIKRGSFFPVPEVSSCLVKLNLLSKPRMEIKSEDMLFKVIRTAFGQRRKTILSALSQRDRLGLNKNEVAYMLDNLGIDLKTRAESLALGQFAKVADGIVDFLS